ncbi:MAG: hypothetical protein AAGG07_06020 [Planctomycetota bacterium]
MRDNAGSGIGKLAGADAGVWANLKRLEGQLSEAFFQGHAVRVHGSGGVGNMKAIASRTVLWCALAGVVAWFPACSEEPKGEPERREALETREASSALAVEELVRENVLLINELLERARGETRTTEDTPWILFHALLALGPDDATLTVDGTQHGLRSWMLDVAAWDPDAFGIPLTHETGAGPVFARAPSATTFKVLEDHRGQFLYILAEASTDPRSTSVRMDRDEEPVPIEQFAHALVALAEAERDLSWALPALAHFGVPVGAVTRDELESLLRRHLEFESESLRQCWGHHWVTGLVRTTSWASDAISGDLHAETRSIVERRYVAFRDQWAAGLVSPLLEEVSRGLDDAQRRELEIWYRGHAAEWLVLGATDSQFATDLWLHQYIYELAGTLGAHESDLLASGEIAHAVHALRRYVERVRAAI